MFSGLERDARGSGERLETIAELCRDFFDQVGISGFQEVFAQVIADAEAVAEE